KHTAGGSSGRKKWSPPARGRGLKPRPPPPAGARFGSPPARGRGLKLGPTGLLIVALGSPPARGRGLKPLRSPEPSPSDTVAPRAGAWIETSGDVVSVCSAHVAPRAGAWIETSASSTPCSRACRRP